MFNNRAGVQKPLFSSNTLCWRLFVCHWICNGQRLHAYTSVIIARATARLYVILFMVMQWPDSVYSRWKEYPDAFFFWERERGRHYSTPSFLSTLCILPPSKAAKNTGNSSKCLYMRLCKPYSKTAGFLGFSTFHFCSFRPLQKPIFLCMS